MPDLQRETQRSKKKVPGPGIKDQLGDRGPVLQEGRATPYPHSSSWCTTHPPRRSGRHWNIKCESKAQATLFRRSDRSFFCSFLKYLFGCTGSWLQHLKSFSCSMSTLNCSMWDLVPQQGIKLWTPCIGSMESQPLDHRRSLLCSLLFAGK